MYKIIGADQQEYGPVTGDQIRQWIAEGRVNAQTRARVEGTEEWKPIGTFPEFAAVFTVPAAAGAPAAISAAELEARDYDLDIGGCISRGWELLKNNFWPLVGITLLILFISNAVNQIVSLISKPSLDEMIRRGEFSVTGASLLFLTTVLSMPVTTVFMGGLYQYYLKLIRGQNPAVGDAFSGFTNGFGQLVLLGLVQGFLICLGFLLCIIPGIYLAVAWYFAMPLIVDKGLGFWEAMELSRKMVSKHWFAVFGLALLAGLVGCLGLIACCIGVFVTLPIAFAAIMYGYEDIFNRKTA